MYKCSQVVYKGACGLWVKWWRIDRWISKVLPSPCSKILHRISSHFDAKLPDWSKATSIYCWCSSIIHSSTFCKMLEWYGLWKVKPLGLFSYRLNHDLWSPAEIDLWLPKFNLLIYKQEEISAKTEKNSDKNFSNFKRESYEGGRQVAVSAHNNSWISKCKTWHIGNMFYLWLRWSEFLL